MHPRKVVKDKHPNASNTSKTKNLIVLKKKNVNKCKHDFIVFWHPDFVNEELYIVARYCRVLIEGPCSEFFRENVESIEGVEDNVPVVDEGLDPIQLVPNLTDNLTEDIVQLTLDMFELDEDYVPAEENIPAPT